MKIFKKSKAKKDAKIAEGIKSLTDKFKLREKIDKANQWADKHKKRVHHRQLAHADQHIQRD